MRILGRTGYVNVKIVDSIAQLGNINKEMPQILSMINFTPGNTYTDFKPGSDHLATYGIAGLIAGGILAKVGFFKGLLVLGAAFWKVIAAGAVAFLVGIRKFFKKLVNRNPAT